MSFVKFLNCKIDLRKQVFIPRPETEFWMKEALKELKAKSIRSSSSRCDSIIENCKLKILDIFAGSGCIGIAVLKNIKNSRADFVDIDERAIEQIKINLKLNKISPKRYKIYKSNIFKKIKDKRYNLIFANPPYVASERLKEVQPSVLKYEPKIALFGGKKGLFYIKKFLKEAKKNLKPKGVIYLEFDPLQKKDIIKLLEKFSYNNYQFFKDQFFKYRFLKCF